MVLAFASWRRYNTRLLVNVSTGPTTNRAWLTVDLGHLVANARTVQAAAGGADLLPVVKADAYGLGAVPAARALESLDPWGFAVATVDEALRLREAGIERPLLVFTPAVAGQHDVYREYALRAVLEDPVAASMWEVPYHVEIDTGMGRCGVRWKETETLSSLDTSNLEGAFTHFYAADEGSESVARQWSRFVSALAAFSRRPALLHAQNSAAAWRLPTPLDLVRPGVFLYGGEHAPDLPGPAPVAAVRAPVVSVRRIDTGESVSYGADWVAPRPTAVATLGIGYADGVPRAVEGKAQVLLAGARRPVIGRVTMDFVMIDLGDVGDRTSVGDIATIIGKDGNQEITVAEFSTWSGTISYETLTRFALRLRREYSGP